MKKVLQVLFLLVKLYKVSASDTDDLFIKTTITGIPGTFTIQNDALFKQNDNVILVGGGGGSVKYQKYRSRFNYKFLYKRCWYNYQIGDQLTFDNQNTDGAGAIQKSLLLMVRLQEKQEVVMTILFMKLQQVEMILTQAIK